MRSKIRRLLRKPEYRDAIPAAHGVTFGQGGGGVEAMAQTLFEQAKSPYRYWPEVEVDRLFTEG